MAGVRQADDRGPALCEYFVTCERPADGTVTHPVAGVVPVCAPCALLARLYRSPVLEAG